MAQDDIKKSGTPSLYRTTQDKGTLITEPVLGIVKNNIDPTKSGRIQVYVAKLGGQDPNDSKSWVTVSYLSPYLGVVAPGNDVTAGPNTTGYGQFVGNPQSYGFWASAPDVGTQVVCIFVDGRPDQGYYIGCVPQAGLLSMTPAIGSTNNVVPNEAEATTYGGADRVPTTEINYSNPSLRKSPTLTTEPKPIHSYQAAILNNQGLIRDNIRGVISSSAQRETPSRVFGISTPGGAIYEGGYTNSTIKEAAASSGPDKLKVVGRTGGHSIVLDDGGLNGGDQLVRIRTSAGHQIMMNDSGQSLFIIHSNGESWIELGKEGTIDMYATNSVNIRSKGDLNFHADRDVNIHAKRNLTMFGDNLSAEADQDVSIRAGKNFSGYSGIHYTFKADGAMSMASSGAASMSSSSIAFVNGTRVNLNTGNSPLTPKEVKPLSKISHTDSEFSQAKGWLEISTEPMLSVTSRAPAHMPWVSRGKGVDTSS